DRGQSAAGHEYAERAIRALIGRAHVRARDPAEPRGEIEETELQAFAPAGLVAGIVETFVALLDQRRFRLHQASSLRASAIASITRSTMASVAVRPINPIRSVRPASGT